MATTRKIPSGLLVEDLDTAGSDYKRYQAYKNYALGRQQARRLAFYSKLAKYWGSRCNLLALIPGVSALTTGVGYAYTIYNKTDGNFLERAAEAGSIWLAFLFVTSVPFFNVLMNHYVCTDIRNVLQRKIQTFLNRLPNKNDKKNLDVSNKTYKILKTNILDEDLQSQNDLVVMRRLTVQEFQAYELFKSMGPVGLETEVKESAKPKKLFTAVKNWRGAPRYNLYMDQEQNARFNRNLQPVPTLFHDSEISKSKARSRELAAEVVAKYLPKA